MGRRRGTAPELEAQIGRIRAAIVLIADQRTAAKARAGTTVVSQARARQLVREQQRSLDAAHAEIRAARDAAGRAAESAGPGRDAALYERTWSGFGVQLQVIETAQSQLGRLFVTSSDQTRQSGEVLGRTLRTLDGALREQLTLLTRLERLERERVIVESRHASGDGSATA